MSLSATVNLDTAAEGNFCSALELFPSHLNSLVVLFLIWQRLVMVLLRLVVNNYSKLFLLRAEMTSLKRELFS